jgi:hypothetical protein
MHVRLPGDAGHHEPRLERRSPRVGPTRVSLERGLDLNLSHPQHRHDQNSAQTVLVYQAVINVEPFIKVIFIELNSNFYCEQRYRMLSSNMKSLTIILKQYLRDFLSPCTIFLIWNIKKRVNFMAF